MHDTAVPSPVDVFRINLADPDLRDVSIVSVAETQRANKFKRARDSERYLASHVALRLILGRRLGCAPQEILLKEGVFGKPVVATAPDVEFSLSRSGEIALIAISELTPVGVDIEMVGRSPGSLPLPLSQLAPFERIALSALEPHQQLAAFFRCWVRKEAVLKAAGIGLRKGLQHFVVPISSNSAPDAAMTVSLPGGEQWRLFDIPLRTGYAAAVAMKSSVYRAPSLQDFSV